MRELWCLCKLLIIYIKLLIDVHPALFEYINYIITVISDLIRKSDFENKVRISLISRKSFSFDVVFPSFIASQFRWNQEKQLWIKDFCLKFSFLNKNNESTKFLHQIQPDIGNIIFRYDKFRFLSCKMKISY